MSYIRHVTCHALPCLNKEIKISLIKCHMISDLWGLVFGKLTKQFWILPERKRTRLKKTGPQ